jgi:hypothetical protein
MPVPQPEIAASDAPISTQQMIVKLVFFSHIARFSKQRPVVHSKCARPVSKDRIAHHTDTPGASP